MSTRPTARRPLRAGFGRIGLGLAAAAGLLASCSDADPDGRSNGGGAPPNGTAARVVERLESLAFVPRGRTSIDSPLDVGSELDLLVDRYELTVGEWAELFGEDDPVPPAFHQLSDVSRTERVPAAWSTDVPVVGMTLDEARRAADARGMRLPTFEEWMWCAVGPRTRRLPAGRKQRGLANTIELGLVRRTPVGAFESGKTPDTGIFDLLGNVWEWTEAPPPAGDWKPTNPDAWPADGGATAPAWVAGGSFAASERPMFTRDRIVFVQALTAGHRGSDVGMRCVAGAGEYLAALPATPAIPRAARERLVVVGATWGPRAVDTLQELADAGAGGVWVTALLEGASR